jgi:nucleoside-diphosphate-sugar epimerase
MAPWAARRARASLVGMANSLGRVCVTGATGKAGLAAVLHLREQGYEVVATDIALGRDDVAAGVLAADLTDYGQAVEVLSGTDAVVHLANVPAPGRSTPAVTFHANITMNFNVFHAAAALRLTRVVWASSETTLGLPFGGGRGQTPGAPGELRYAPVDEDHYPFPATTYALSKVASETIAEQISRWSGTPFVGLRFSNIMEPHDYQRFPAYWPDPHARKWNLWGYVDVRDVAAACRLGLDADVSGSSNVIIAAADTVMNRPSRDLLAEVFPDVTVTREIAGHESLLSIDRAKQLLGYAPAHSWRDHLQDR